MNVIVSNKQKSIIDNANIDAIKDLNGLFNVDDLISKFKNYFFSKMILDATSLVNFTSDDVLQKLVSGIGAERLVILLPAVPEPPQEFIDKLHSLKIYNFSNDINEIVNLLNNPKTQDSFSPIEGNNQNGFYVDNSVKEDDNSQVTNNFNNDLSLTGALNSISITANPGEMQNQTEISNNSFDSMQSENNISNMFDNVPFNQENNVFNNNMPINDSMMNTVANNIQMDNMANNNLGNNSFSQNNDLPSNLNLNNVVSNGMNNVFLHPNLVNEMNNVNSNKKIVIGFKNVTIHAGSTSLVYMLYKTIKGVLNKSVTAYEIDCDNFKYYQERGMISCSSNDIVNLVSNCNSEVVLIDLNNYSNLEVCTDVLFLVEPSVIRLNRLMMEDSSVFNNLQNRKVVLNMSLLTDNEVNAFSNEAKVTMFYNIPPLNDRKDNNVLIGLLNKLGIK